MIPPSLRFLPVLLLTIAVLFAPEADAQNADQLKIDENWVTMIQQEDQSAFMTHEYIFLNNSANSIYNGSIAVWIQDDSNILAECCGGASNMACRYREDGYMSCFNFQRSGQNTYTGNPFYGDNKLSYYGQTGTVTLTGTSNANASLSNVLILNATIGPLSKPREGEPPAGVLVLSSANKVIGMRPIIDVYMPHNITTSEKITIYNRLDSSYTVSLTISGVPQDWTAKLMNGSQEVEEIALAPQGSVNLTLVLTAPSHITPIYYGYMTELGETGQENQRRFSKEYTFDTAKIQYQIFTLGKEAPELSDDLVMVHPYGTEDPSWNDGYARYWFVAQTMGDALSGSTTEINLKVQGETAPSTREPFPFEWLLVIIGIGLIVVAFIARSIPRFTGVPEEEDADWDIETIQDEIKELEDLIARVESDLAEGLMAETTGNEILAKWRADIEELDQEIAEIESLQAMASIAVASEEDIKRLEEQKSKVLQSLKRVEQEFEEGLISEEEYESIRAGYKKRAVELLKELDLAKGNG